MTFQKIIFVKILFFFPFCIYASDHFFEFLNFKNYTRFVLKADIKLAVQVNSFKNSFEIVLQDVNFNDLGISSGQEIDEKTKIAAFQDERMKNIKIFQDSKNIKITGNWTFPIGKKKLVHEVVEHFYYKISHTREHIIDFWFKENMTIDHHYEVELKKISKIFFSAGEQNKKKRISEEKRIHVLEQEDRFLCDKLPFENQIEVFLDFNVLHRPVRFEKWFSRFLPDKNYTYKQPEDATLEALYLKYALNLAEQSRWALALRILEFLDQEIKKMNSKHFYEPEISFLKANLNLKLGFFETGENLLKEIIKNFHESEESFLSSVYLYLRKTDSVSSWVNLQNFKFMIQNFFHSKLNWVFHLGAAENFYALKQTESALREYEWVFENAPDTASKAEALFRVGDLYFDRKQYEQAFFAYTKSIRTYPHKVKDFPEVYLNQAESLYRLSQLNEAREIFKKFLENHSNHPAGWRATFRIGEIYDLTAKSKEDLKKGRKWYYQTINSYPHSPGVTLSRLKLAPCEDHGGLSSSLLENFFSHDAELYTGNHEVSISLYPYLKAISHIKYKANVGEIKQSLEVAGNELKRLKKNELYKIIESYFFKTFKGFILTLIQEKKHYEAIRFYNESEKTIMILDEILKRHDTQVYDQSYLLVLSEVALNLHLKDFALHLLQKYESFKKRSKTFKNKDLSQENFIMAKYLWLQDEMKGSKKNTVEIIRHLSNVSDDSFYTFEKHVILGLLALKESNFQSAISHASQAQVLIDKNEDHYEEKNLRIDCWIAGMYLNANNLDFSSSLFSKIEKKIKLIDKKKVTGEYFLSIPQLPTFDEIILTEGSIFEKLNHWEKACEVYSISMNHEIKNDQIYYKYARMLSKLNAKQSRSLEHKIKKEINELNNYLKNTTESFWKKLALEVLSNN